MMQSVKSWKSDVERSMEDFFTARINNVDDPTMRFILTTIEKVVRKENECEASVIAIAAHNLFSEPDEKMVRASISMDLLRLFSAHGMKSHQQTLDLVSRIMEELLKENLFSNIRHGQNTRERLYSYLTGLSENLSLQALLNSGFRSERLLASVSELSQINDLCHQRRILHIKTNRDKDWYSMSQVSADLMLRSRVLYSFPMRIGAIMSGDLKHLGSVNKFGSLIGMSAIIRDDLRTIFSQDRATESIRRGSTFLLQGTLPVAKAFERSSQFERESILSWMERGINSIEDLQLLRDIVLKTRSLDFSENVSREFLEKGKSSLDDMGLNTSMRGFMMELADMLANP